EGLKADGTSTTATRSVSTAWDTVLRKPLTITHTAAGQADWVESFAYDAHGNTLTKGISSGTLARMTSYRYDAQGTLVLVDGCRTDVHDVTTTTYFNDNDPFMGCRGQPSTMTDALGHITTFVAYDSNGHLIEEKDPNGVVTKSTYDNRGRLTSTTRAFGLS